MNSLWGGYLKPIRMHEQKYGTNARHLKSKHTLDEHENQLDVERGEGLDKQSAVRQRHTIALLQEIKEEVGVDGLTVSTLASKQWI